MSRRLRNALLTPLPIALVIVVLSACGSRREPPPPFQPQRPGYAPPGYGAPPQAAPAPSPAIPRPAPTTGSACALDAKWITDLGKPPPRKSTLMRFDEMRQRGSYGPEGPVTTFNEFGRVTRRSEEKYEWEIPNSTRSDEQLVVLRGASGPIPSMYAPQPIRLASGVHVHKEKQRTGLFGGVDPPSTLFVFPDGTWVRADAPLADQIKATLAERGTPPPLPATHADVAWELCGEMDPNDIGLPWDRWTIRGKRVTVRLFASRKDGELVYPFDTPALAATEAERQRQRCRNNRCRWMKRQSVEGDFVRYDVSIRTAPHSRHTNLFVAHTTPRLKAPPPAIPGRPPSGVYLQFVDIVADTCPTRSAGKRFPRMHDQILLTQRGAKTFAELESVEPRAPGIMTASRMPDVELRVGSIKRTEATHLCPNYKIAREMTVLEVAKNRIQVRDIVRHVGSTVGCRHPNLPSNCHHEAVTTWVLRREACAAHCSATPSDYMSFSSEGPAPPPEAHCACP